MPRTPSSPVLLAGLLATASVAHAIAPKQFDATIPSSLPGTPRQWTYASGAAELVLAAGVAHPRTRRVAALAAAAFFVGVFPANVKMAVDARRRSPAAVQAVTIARLPLQLPLVLWARNVSRGAAG
ncbi:DoxX family protein [Streptomyces sp. NBC_00354]|uniref:DoxX family protein n=1 Tax=Streptomyces sp. NBC_00354 TaxID=2975723 RepID=UPI002E259B6F